MHQRTKSVYAKRSGPEENKNNHADALGTNVRSAGGALSRLLKNAPK